jgi:hypothetical protein
MTPLEELVPGPLLPALMTPRPGLEHPVRRDDIGNSPAPTESRDAQKRRLPDPVKMDDVGKVTIEFFDRGVGTNEHPCLPQVPFEAPNRDFEPARPLRLRRLEKIYPQAPATSR